MRGVLGRLIATAHGRCEARALILLYHRVAELPRDPWGLAVTPTHFREHLAVLRRCGVPITLRALVDALRGGRIRRGVIAVTFDDGYADNASAALPLLERYDVAATCFVTTGAIASPREFWWDELERVVLEPAILPGELRVGLAGQEHVWKLADGAPPIGPIRADWRAWEDDPNPRAALYRWVYERLFPLPEHERRAVLDGLSTWAGRDDEVRATHRPLGLEELARLAQSPGIEVGAHAVTHTPLSALSPPAQDGEIRESKRRLETLIGRPIESFAYPYGRPSDWDLETPARVRDAGFGCACTTVREAVQSASDLFQLPRLGVPDCNGDAFERMLKSWLTG